MAGVWGRRERCGQLAWRRMGIGDRAVRGWKLAAWTCTSPGDPSSTGPFRNRAGSRM